MNWFVYALLAALCIAAYHILSRLFLRDRGDARAFAFWTDLSGAFLLVTLAIFEKRYFHPSFLSILTIILVAIIAGTVDSLLMKGRRTEEASTTSIVNQTGSTWAFLGGLLFFGESLTTYKVVGVLLILFGNLVILWKGRRIALSPGVKYFLLGTLLSNTGYLIDKRMVGDVISPATYKVVIFLLSSLWIFMSLPNRRKRISDELRLQRWAFVATGFLLALSIFFLMKSLQLGEASRVLPIYASSVVFSVVAGIVLLKERERLSQKVFGVLVTFLGVLVLRLL